ncbi:YHS domain-containing protein [Thermaerobacter marianensis DSM 12885]|uniref:YHS domain-containing protein n=1 Tax=Thermaerobacter marianensis (strain ATCC 700841 / DSM 12885 / JCM 10246 / 7p75a) TaxID=644966 RepID=E6SGE9_THEM7|nr:XdhC family protein [Thermaerobacter marianensis]ADU51601.1 YHS domain-containing protein [Thermaerobacter marianensis DSM 12885]
MAPGVAVRSDAVLVRAAELRAQGRSFALATVIRRRPPVSSRAGDKALVTADGHLEGWIGGSCSESVVREQALAALADGRPRLVQIRLEAPAGDATGHDHGAATDAGAGDARVVTVAMTCPSGGEVDVYIEPFVRPPQLIACGDTPLAVTLAQLAAMVGFEPVLVYGREAPAEATLPGGRAIPVDALADFDPAPEAYAVVASMGHFDEECLQRWLAAGVPYVALVASRRRAAAVKEVLAAAGVPAADLERIRNPAGLDLGSVTQEEIAVAILADIIRQRRTGLGARTGLAVAGGAEPGPAVGAGSGHPEPAAAPAAVPGDAGTAVGPEGAEGFPLVVARDPVCGMQVRVAEARHVAEHAGRRYYFCCAHCKAAFLRDPAAYAAGA